MTHRAMEEQLPSIESADRISALPDEIIHRILYRLEAPRQVARTSVLSLRWLQLWQSYPVLEFDEKEERRHTSTGDEYLYDYAAFAASSMRRLSMYYENCRTPLDLLRISLPLNCRRFRSLLASALGSDYGSPLEVMIQSAAHCLVFPPDSLSNCSRTKVLKLHSVCGLEGLVLRQPMSCLQVLNLARIKLHEAHMLYYFVENAPNLETLSLEECFLGFKKLEISASNFRRLKTLEIRKPSKLLAGPFQLELQLTTAPFLERLIVSERWKPGEYKAASSSSAPNLKVLRIRTSCITPPYCNLDDFIAKLPALEVLEISPDDEVSAIDHTDLHLITSSTPCLHVMDVLAVRKLSIQTSPSSSSRVKQLNLRIPWGFTQGHLDDVISKLPCLESLCLMFTRHFKSRSSEMSKMRVSIRQLRAFQLRDCCFEGFVRVPEEMTLPELELDAPNLVSVRIDTYFRLPDKVNIVNVPPNCRFVVGGKFFPSDNTMSWFLLLKKFLSALSPFHLILRWQLNCQRISFDLSRAECTSPPLIIERLQLEMGLLQPASSRCVRTILDGLFWACRPKLYCITDHFMHKQFNYEDEDVVVAKCCVGKKCWRHELIDAKIEDVSYVDRKQIKFVPDPSAIFKVSSPMIKHVKTCFSLTWR